MKIGNNKYIIAIPVIAASIGAAVFFAQGTAAEDEQRGTVKLSDLRKDDPLVLGDPSAPLLIMEWGDYQCTYCHRFHQDTRDSVLSNFVATGKARFTFMDFTLNGPASVLAAEASYCASDQGRYWEYHDELYNNWEGENTGWVNMQNLKKFASSVGLEAGAFDECLKTHKYEQMVINNYKFGQSIGISATPTFLVVDGEGKALVIRGAQPYETFDTVLSERLAQLET